VAARGQHLNARSALPGDRRAETVAAAQIVAAAGTAVVGAAKVGRLLTRSGWGIVRRLPGGAVVQREVQRLQDIALAEARRLFEITESLPAVAALGEEQRAALFVHNHDPGIDPLRGAMSELLERSVETDRTASRDYLYGNIISQLVPDEARILAALSDGSPFAVLDVVAKPLGRAATRTVLANASSVGRAAGVVTTEAVPTYVTRLHRFGLVEFGPPDEAIQMQFEVLATESIVQAAEASIQARHHGAPKLIRKTMVISQFGKDFWAACDPSRPSLPAG
jgi:hypothetical protein